MKKAILLVLAGLLAVLAWLTAPFAVRYFSDPIQTVERNNFQTRLRDCLQNAGFILTEQRSTSGREVPLPLLVAWRIPRRPPPSSGPLLEIGLPYVADEYRGTVDGRAEFDCFVRYVDGQACYLEIRAPARERPAAESLRTLLRGEFPGLPVGLKIR